MLDVLCGNQNVKKILIFLFVNHKCYGTQLHRLLRTSLNPIQKALLRLEKGGIITSYYEGKTRLYQFNPAFPLLHELEQLLKKAYTLLPAQEKKSYYVLKENDMAHASFAFSPVQALHIFWNRLSTVKQLIFHAKTKSSQEVGWNGKGQGEVSILKNSYTTLVFQEKGQWQNQEGHAVNFTNAFRWTLDKETAMISLEHLRRGPDHPVFLFHLTPISPSSLISVDSHLCEGDIYFGQLHFDANHLRLNWRVIGPKKNEEIDYYYT